MCLSPNDRCNALRGAAPAVCRASDTEGRCVDQLAKREPVCPFERVRCASTLRGVVPFVTVAAAATAGIPMDPNVGTRSAWRAW
ncbi:hypothetical protein CHELA41_20011 [Hyphomicrobiales bacterium]|nr:hypothetical protein CHELA41_20011 [Hyphomicrobiales bacterium]